MSKLMSDKNMNTASTIGTIFTHNFINMFGFNDNSDVN